MPRASSFLSGAVAAGTPRAPVLLLAGFGLLALLADGCKDDGALAEGALCTPGENIFCRCLGGHPGTKSCNDDGDAFGECLPCDPRPTTGPGQQSSSSGSSVGGAGPGAGGGGPGVGGGGTGDAPLLSYCDSNGDCQSGMCRFHYCTMPCTLISECPYPASECVDVEHAENCNEGDCYCMPTCSTAVDCALYNAPPSLCGYTQAIDNWDVTVCAEWGANHALMPFDTDCLPFDHDACNLGYQGREVICSEQGICAKGCYLNVDCPMGKTCSSQGALGQCQ
jgi:hypothetical protein